MGGRRTGKLSNEYLIGVTAKRGNGGGESRVRLRLAKDELVRVIDTRK